MTNPTPSPTPSRTPTPTPTPKPKQGALVAHSVGPLVKGAALGLGLGPQLRFGFGLDS